MKTKKREKTENTTHWGGKTKTFNLKREKEDSQLKNYNLIILQSFILHSGHLPKLCVAAQLLP